MHTKLHMLAVPASMQTTNDLRRILDGLDYLQLTLLPVGSRVPEFKDGSSLDVLLYEMPEVNEEGLGVLQALLKGIDEETAILVIGRIDSPALMRRLMHMGIDDVLRDPLDAAELLPALQGVLHDRQEQQAAAHLTCVVSFFNAFGNSGTTLLAVNTATELASRHKASVALLDFDIQFGKAAHFLDLKPQANMVDALGDADRLDQVFLNALMCEHETGVHLLAAPALLAPLNVQIAAVHKIVQTAAAMYDVVIVDLPRLITNWTLLAMLQSDKVLIVTQNNLSAIRDTRKLMDFLPAQGLPAGNIEVVNARAMSRHASTSIEQMKKTLGLERLHRIRNDYATALAAEDQGLPLARVAPRSALTEDCAHLADHIWRHNHAADVDTQVRVLSWFDRLLGRQAPVSSVGLTAQE
jgi:pilus assembly protein CpaE